MQHLGAGTLETAPVPCPRPDRGKLLIESRASLISAGTERMLVEFGQASWLSKARQQPDRVRQLLDKVRTDGARAAIGAVQAKLDREIPLGYANAGRVVETGEGVTGFRPGDRVVSNGPHAEMVAVPQNLCARIPEPVADDEAPFAVLAAIALEGIRLIGPTIGERVVVSGLGLVGLLAAQLLRLNGCRVLGLDFDPARLKLASRWGVETFRLDAGEPAAALNCAARFSEGRGVDAVLIAAATTSAEPVRMAAGMCRQRGRIVLTGVAGLELERDLFYKKELSFQVSCSYGPGRYDDAYEKRGQDYPFGHVRWTAQRNFEAALDLMADRRLDVRPLITHEFPLERAQQAYDVLTSGEPSLGIVLRYAAGEAARPAKLDTRIVLARYRTQETNQEQALTGIIGAGEFAGKVLLPAMRSERVAMRTVVSATGLGAAWAARRFRIPEVSTDENAVLDDPAIQAVVIATRHDSHARLAIRALEAGKSVWVEKPLAMTEEELDRIEEIWAARPEVRLMTGFNRRFAPLTEALRRAMKPGRHDFRYTVNAGTLEAAHWTADSREGGGRILGEACHFIDLLRSLAGARIENLEARRSGAGAHLWIEFAGGATGAIDYLTEGSREFPKERLEVFGSGQVLVLDNFRRLIRYPSRLMPRLSQWRRPFAGQDKGHRAAIAAFFASVRQGTPPPIPVDEQLEVSRWAIRAAEALR